jgi:hypothetical protein
MKKYGACVTRVHHLCQKKNNNRCPLLLPECLPQQVTVFLMGIIEAMEILPWQVANASSRQRCRDHEFIHDGTLPAGTNTLVLRIEISFLFFKGPVSRTLFGQLYCMELISPASLCPVLLTTSWNQFLYNLTGRNCLKPAHMLPLPWKFYFFASTFQSTVPIALSWPHGVADISCRPITILCSRKGSPSSSESSLHPQLEAVWSNDHRFTGSAGQGPQTSAAPHPSRHQLWPLPQTRGGQRVEHLGRPWPGIRRKISL